MPTAESLSPPVASHLLHGLMALRQGDLLLVFAPADHTHRGWRAAVVAALARKHVPARVNAAASNDAAATTATMRELRCPLRNTCMHINNAPASAAGRCNVLLVEPFKGHPVSHGKTPLSMRQAPDSCARRLCS